jgi:hypothetical protein
VRLPLRIKLLVPFVSLFFGFLDIVETSGCFTLSEIDLFDQGSALLLELIDDAACCRQFFLQEKRERARE